MWPPLTRNLFIPLHESILGRQTLRYARRLERSQWFAPTQLHDLQRQKLRELLHHLATHVPYYNWLRKESAAINDADPFQLLHRIPPIDKSEIRRHADQLVWNHAPGGLHRYSTGGSTGDPLTFFIDRRRQAYDQAARMRTHRWFGVQPGDRELYLWGSPIELSRTDTVKRFRDRLFNHRLCSAFHMSADRMDAYLNEIDRYQPACLFGYPSSLALLAEHAESTGAKIHRRSLRCVFVTGEVCFDVQRRTLRRVFGVPIANGYGSREAGFIAHECDEGSMHITAENVIVEILADGEAVDAGESGEIIVTHLDAYAQPFIRYRTGDVGRLKAGRCACGRGLPMLDVIDGRTTDFLYLPDGSSTHALSVIYALRELPGVHRFRVEQAEDYSLTIRVESTGESPALRTTVQRAVQRVIGLSVPIGVEIVDRVALSDSGKFRFVASAAKPQPQITQQEPCHVRCPA